MEGTIPFGARTIVPLTSKLAKASDNFPLTSLLLPKKTKPMNKNPYSPCDYVMKARDNQPKPLTEEMFETLLDDMNVKFLCDKVREHKPDAERYKTMLPAITWQSRFNGKLRTDLNADPTGYFCLDVDIHHEQMFKEMLQSSGVEAAYKWAGEEAKHRASQWAAMQLCQDEQNPMPAEELGIVAIHVSPSGTGVHVVAVCNGLCNTIEENQKRLAKLLGTEFDPVCKDWARIFFVTPRADWAYLDKNILFTKDDES